jgi:hypothetical protein
MSTATLTMPPCVTQFDLDLDIAREVAAAKRTVATSNAETQRIGREWQREEKRNRTRRERRRRCPG